MADKGRVKTVEGISKRTIFPLLSISLLLYVVAVSGGTVALYSALDERMAIVLHAFCNLLLVLAGGLLGLLVGPLAVSRSKWIIQILLPQRSEGECESLLRSLASIVIVLGMTVSLLWGVILIDQFVDTHSTLLIESDVLLYSMGLVTGISWTVLMKQHAWFGLFISVIGMMMSVVNILSPYSF